MKTYNTAFPYFPEEDIEEILKETREILCGNKMLTMGENVQKFEEQFAKYCQTKYAVATNSCTSALEIALSSLNLTSEDEAKLRKEIENHLTEGDLRREVQMNIKNKMEINSYQGVRHKKGLPVHGQRTSRNAKTRKGKGKVVANKKKVGK